MRHATASRPLDRRAFGALAAAAFAAPGAAFAQFGDKPLRVIMPLSAGSGADGAMRAIGPSVGKALGQPVVIENLPGAGGITGTAQLVRAPKDGQTIGIVSNNHVVNPSVYKSVPFHAIDDITPITVIGATPFVLVAHPSVPAKNVQELVALARSRPGQLNYGSSGNGTILHLGAEMFVHEAQVQIKHIPYRGMGPLMADVLGGQVQLAVVAVAPAAAHIRSGALRALGVTTAQRTPALPEVPTIAEQGLPNYALEGWIAAIGPAGLPRAEVNRLYEGFKAAVAMPEARDALVAQGYTVQMQTPEATAAFFRTELARMAAVVRQAKVQMD
ncbi:tripartite tricarboxylate transporter substrate binding protein [Xylophilus sp. Leaf220]|uniref:tripartite tricarboxylate transporter substrate binding protein n=1 Tax=Xylophilus sp. Leaf220 TaxID=1735686 RepID=UPI0006F8515A|nr:tripartite tricarboxylate transporter substrate binding protein [Xylophilus sp. Leaf220]KQM76023.1 ABC transporter substrate-binding protein [Xylophilus sp. Leaf220]